MSQDNLVNPLQIRPFTNRDAALLFDFFQSLSDKTRSAFRPHPFTREYAEVLTGEDLKNAETIRFLASTEENGQEKMIGYFFFWDWHMSVPYFGIAVADQYQERKIGGKIMAFANDYARQNGKGGILLTTDKSNLRGQALYKRNGFEIIGDGPSAVPEYLLVKRFGGGPA